MIDEKDIRKAATLTYNPALDAVANFSVKMLSPQALIGSSTPFGTKQV